jgi:hypothetical protein
VRQSFYEGAASAGSLQPSFDGAQAAAVINASSRPSSAFAADSRTAAYDATGHAARQQAASTGTEAQHAGRALNAAAGPSATASAYPHPNDGHTVEHAQNTPHANAAAALGTKAAAAADGWGGAAGGTGTGTGTPTPAPGPAPAPTPASTRHGGRGAAGAVAAAPKPSVEADAEGGGSDAGHASGSGAAEPTAAATPQIARPGRGSNSAAKQQQAADAPATAPKGISEPALPTSRSKSSKKAEASEPSAASSAGEFPIDKEARTKVRIIF